MIFLSDSVGKGGRNYLSDVKKVQDLLNASPVVTPKLVVDQKYGPKMYHAILQYQMSIFREVRSCDGLIEANGKTLRALNSPNTPIVKQVNPIAVQDRARAEGGHAASPGNNADSFCFPLRQSPNPDWTGGARYFGASRSAGRLHAGCDLLGPEGTPIYAIADGQLIRGPYQFTGPHNRLPVTSAVEIRHGDILVRYGEIMPGSYVGGSKVRKGQIIAKIGACKMLHFEVYTNGLSSASLSGSGQYKRRGDVTNPAPYLDKWVKNLPSL
jgi:murein DD-endopeptidase MepM/ murein hydrolase activator NlpD